MFYSIKESCFFIYFQGLFFLQYDHGRGNPALEYEWSQSDPFSNFDDYHGQRIHPPKTNLAHENRPLEKEIHISGNHHVFCGFMSSFRPSTEEPSEPSGWSLWLSCTRYRSGSPRDLSELSWEVPSLKAKRNLPETNMTSPLKIGWLKDAPASFFGASSANFQGRLRLVSGSPYPKNPDPSRSSGIDDLNPFPE